MPKDCDDGPFGKGTGGRLTYELKLPAGGSQSLWIGVAGSDDSPADARSALRKLTRDPARALREKQRTRKQLARWTQLWLPGDPQLQDSIEWGKQNLADLTQEATGLDLRWTNQGKEWTHVGSLARMRWIGAGYPDYPWLFGVDGEYTAHASVSLGQFEAIEDHLRALRDISDQLSARSGVVVHEVVPTARSGSAATAAGTNPDGTISYDFNTDEILKFPAAVALVWRWTGDDRFRDEMLDFMGRGLDYVATKLDDDHDGWPQGNGNVERTGMGPEKLDNAVYYIRALYDYADMARSAGMTAKADAAQDKADGLAGRFESTWWMPAEGAYADSLTDPGNVPTNQKHWIGATPMEAELVVDGETVPGLASPEHGTRRARDAREQLLQRRAAGQPRPVPHRLRRRPDGRRRVQHLLDRHRDHGRRGGQLRAARRGAAAALHRRERRDAVRRAGDRRDAGRAAGRDAGDLPLADSGAADRHTGEHRPLLDLPVDVHAGLGPLRHGLVGRPPGPRRAAGPRPRPAGDHAAACRATSRCRGRTSGSATAASTSRRRTRATAT